MKFHASERASSKKSEVAALRRSGKIPAVVYLDGQENALVSIDATEFQAFLRNVKPGQLATSVFTLTLGGKEHKAIVKDIQYHPTSYEVIHLDFQQLAKGKPVSVKVPISFTGAADCVGIKLGGFLRQVIRSVKVQCPSDAIPAEFIVDVRDLGLFQSKRLSDLTLPKGVRPLVGMDEVVVVVSKR